MTFKQLFQVCVPNETRKKERFFIWDGWVLRPLSILFTIPLLKSKITPTDVTIISVIFSLAGGILLCWPSKSLLLPIIGWCCFCLWAILDGVDGNLARATNQCSAKGELWDAIGGYASMVLIYMGAGIRSFFDNNFLPLGPNYLMLIVCAFSSLAALFPRLIMHKQMTISNGAINKTVLNDKANFGLREIIISNFISVAGFMQVIFLLCILTHTLNIFTCVYCLINFSVMIVSLHRILNR